MSVPHQPEKPPTLSASATLWLAASSTCSGLLDASAGLASARSPSRKAFCAGFSSSHGVSKQPPIARLAPPSRTIRRGAVMVFRTASVPLAQNHERAGRSRSGRARSRRLGPRLDALFLFHLLLGELADGSLGQLRPDLESDRHLVLADLALEMLLQFLEGERGAGLQLDEHLGRFLAVGIGDADHDTLIDRGKLVDRLLDHARIDVVARRDDEVLGAIDQEQPAVAVHVAHVTGAQALPVAVGMAEQDLLGLLGLLPVALHHLRADDADLADIVLARRQHALALLHVADLDDGARHRQ